MNDLSRYPALPERLLANARVIADRNAALSLWPKGAVIAEIGVGLGDFSRLILDVCQPSRFLALDLFDLHQLPMLWGRSTAETFGGLTHEALYRQRFAVEISAGLVEVIRGDSTASLQALPNQSVDVFYVDADHIYESVRRELEALLPKVKADGWIILNDYVPADTFSNVPLGVIQAGNEFMIEHGWEMAYLALAPMMYCDVGLRRVGAAGARR